MIVRLACTRYLTIAMVFALSLLACVLLTGCSTDSASLPADSGVDLDSGDMQADAVDA